MWNRGWILEWFKGSWEKKSIAYQFSYFIESKCNYHNLWTSFFCYLRLFSFLFSVKKGLYYLRILLQTKKKLNKKRNPIHLIFYIIYKYKKILVVGITLLQVFKTIFFFISFIIVYIFVLCFLSKAICSFFSFTQKIPC